jgi:hypothetical protein
MTEQCGQDLIEVTPSIEGSEDASAGRKEGKSICRHFFHFVMIDG